MKKMKVPFKIEIIGAGVVGEAVGKALIGLGHIVHFIDFRTEIITRLKGEGLSASPPETAPAANVSFLCVPTPTSRRKPDYEALRDACSSLGKRMTHRNGYQLAVVKSTVLPGVTEEIVIPSLERSSGLKLGFDFGVCVSPEFLRHRYAGYDAANPKVIVIGANTPSDGDILADINKDLSCPVIRMSLKEAELQKYVHNIFNAIKISFFNEMREVSKELGLTPQSIFEATLLSSEGMWNPQYGTRDWGPFGGSCLPKDLEAFKGWTDELGSPLYLVNAALEQNSQFRNGDQCVE